MIHKHEKFARKVFSSDQLLIRPQGEFVLTGTNPHVSVFEGFIIQKEANFLTKIFQTDWRVASCLDYCYKLL